MTSALRAVSLTALALLTTTVSFGQWHSIGSIDRLLFHDGHTLTLQAGPARVEVRFLSPGIARVRMNPSGDFKPDVSWAVINTPDTPPTLQFRETDSTYQLEGSRLSVSVSKNPLRIRFLDSTGSVFAEDDPAKGMAWSGREVRVWKSMPLGEHYYGFGEKAGLFDRRNTACTMWNSDIPAYTADTDPLYHSIPFFVAIRHGSSYGIFFDNTFRSSFDMGKESRGTYSFGAEDGDLNYYVFKESDPKEILSSYTSLTGRMHLPPLWSLGYQQCRWSYPNERRVREIAEGFRSRSIPCDVIYLDIDYMDGYRIFTFNKKNFPDPKKLTTDLAAQGFKIAVIVDPGIKVDSAYEAYRTGLSKGIFVRRPNGDLYTGKVWPGVCAFPDFTSSAGRAWWGGNFKVLVDAGIRGWWNDMNEPSVFDVPTKTIDLDVVHHNEGRTATHAEDHNVYGMEMTRATYDGVRSLLPEERPFVLTRASYAGGWRYSAAWTGDNVASWEHLNFAASMCLNFGMSGQPFVGSDIGGFIGHPSGELFARWLELGVFTPLMRAHSVIGEVNKEPWEYGDAFTKINREVINLRYTFLPLIYSEMEAASRNGVPAMRPMILEFPDMDEYHGVYDQFMFGENLLVAPVLRDADRRREVRIPRGLWFNYWNDSLITGPATVTVDAPLDRLPLFGRAGAVLPTRQVVQSTVQAPIDPLTITVYPDRQSKHIISEYYEDDGHTFAYEKGVFFRRSIDQISDAASVRVTLSKAEGTYTPPTRKVRLSLEGMPDEPAQVTLNGARLDKATTPDAVGWTYDGSSHSITVVVADSRDVIDVTIRTKADR